LKSEKHPSEDLSGDLANFFVAKDNALVVGAIGLEIYGDDGLLRSLVVKKEYRNSKIASGLIIDLENFARRLDLKNIFLLTETAENYFKQKGYLAIDRSEAPESLWKSSEFSHVCPSTAVLMQKTL
jgi:amino-acid N-acetyltransferase